MRSRAISTSSTYRPSICLSAASSAGRACRICIAPAWQRPGCQKGPGPLSPVFLGKEKKRIHGEVVITMWIDIVMPILFALAILGFISWTGVMKRYTTQKTDRTAESMYDNFSRGDRPPPS